MLWQTPIQIGLVSVCVWRGRGRGGSLFFVDVVLFVSFLPDRVAAYDSQLCQKPEYGYG